MLKVAVVDDDERDSSRIVAYLERFAAETGLKDMRVLTYSDGQAFLDAFTDAFDVVFLDIEMPCLNGMESAKRLREINQDVAVVFVTNMAQYALQGYEVNAIDFIVKPVAYFDFALKFKKVLRYVGRNASKPVRLRLSESETVQADSADILYVEVMQHYLVYHMQGGAEYRLRGTMTEAEETLAPYNFVRCSKSFLVNLRRVRTVRAKEVIVGDATLVIGRTRRAEFLEAYRRFIGGLS